MATSTISFTAYGCTREAVDNWLRKKLGGYLQVEFAHEELVVYSCGNNSAIVIYRSEDEGDCFSIDFDKSDVSSTTLECGIEAAGELGGTITCALEERHVEIAVRADTATITTMLASEDYRGPLIDEMRL